VRLPAGVLVQANADREGAPLVHPVPAPRDGPRALAVRLARAVKILAADGGIPRSLRGLAAFGVLPIPGPVDEAVLVVVGGLLWVFYRERLRRAWNAAA
jgi:hypothetical protein